jgi:hypothetical protein
MTSSSLLRCTQVLISCALVALPLWIIYGSSRRNKTPATPKISPQPAQHDSSSGSKCFRITDVPPGWSKDDFRDSLRKSDPSLGHLEARVSLYPSCCDKASQIALLNFKTCPQFFQRIGPDDSTNLRIHDEFSDETVVLSVDCHFYDLTPLNSPKGEIVAELVHLGSGLYIC